MADGKNNNVLYKIHLLWIFSCLFCIKLEAREYCLSEEFSAKCYDNEVIIMKKAQFGRMKTGKCIASNKGNIGCAFDALKILDDECSGRSECRFYVSSDALLKVNPCEDMLPYLDAEYECMTVQNSKSQFCQGSSPVSVTGNEGHLSSFMARKYGCGNVNNPWLIDPVPGQRINITLVNFKYSDKGGHRSSCKAVGYISEAGHQSNTTICRPTQKFNNVYVSNGRSIKIHLTDYSSEFLLKYKVFGCTDLNVPAYAWYKRDDDVATVGCENSDKVWHLKCVHTKWIGEISNCSEPVPKTAEVSSSSERSTIDIKMITIIGITAIFGVLIIVCGAVIIIHCRKNTTTPPAAERCDDAYGRSNKGPLPAIPIEGQGQYRSLIRNDQPGYQQTIPRGYQPQYQQQQYQPPYQPQYNVPNVGFTGMQSNAPVMQ